MFIAITVLLIGIIILGLSLLVAYQAYEWRFNYLYYYAAGLLFTGIGATLLAAVIEDYTIWKLSMEFAMDHLLFGTVYVSLGILFFIVGYFKIGRLKPNYIDIFYALEIGLLMGLPFATDIFKYEIDRPKVISLDVNLTLELFLAIYLIAIIPNGIFLFKKIKELKPIKFNPTYENAKKAFFILIPIIFVLSMGVPVIGITGIVPIRVLYMFLVGIVSIVFGLYVIRYPLIFAFVSDEKDKYLEIMVLIGSYTITTKVMSGEKQKESPFDSQIRGTAFALINDFVRAAEKSGNLRKKEFFEHSYTYSDRSVAIIQKEKVSVVVISSIRNPQLKRIYKALLENIIRIIKMYMNIDDYMFSEIDYKMVLVINHLINKYIPLELMVAEGKKETVIS